MNEQNGARRFNPPDRPRSTLGPQEECKLMNVTDVKARGARVT